MTTSEELLETVKLAQPKLEGNNASDSDLSSKNLPAASDVLNVRRSSLQIVGFNVNLGSEKLYTVAMDTTESGTADILKISANPELIARETTDALSLEDKSTMSPNKYQSSAEESSEETEDEEHKTCRPMLEVKLAPFREDNNNLEFQLRCHRGWRENEDGNLSCKHQCLIDHPKCHQGEPTNISTETRSTTPPSLVQTKEEVKRDITETCLKDISSLSTQTMKELQSSGIQTEEVLFTTLLETQEASAQTKIMSHVSTNTDALKTTSQISQTSHPALEHSTSQTDRETKTEVCQTETAEIFRIESAYDVSTQTQENIDVATITDLDVYIVDRTRVSEKTTDTADLHEHLKFVVAKAERAADDKKLRQKFICRDSRCTDMVKEDIFQGPNSSGLSQSSLASTCKSDKYPISNGRNCLVDEIFSDNCENENSYLSTINNELINKPSPVDANGSKIQDSYKHNHILKDKENGKKYVNGIGFNSSFDTVEKLRTQEYYTAQIVYLPDELLQKANDLYRLEIAKGLKGAFSMKQQAAIAVQVLCNRRVERAERLQIPIEFQHFLNICNFKLYRLRRVSVNPVKIASSESTRSLLSCRSFKKGNAKPERQSQMTRLNNSTMFSGDIRKNFMVIRKCDKLKSVTIKQISPTKQSPLNQRDVITFCESCYHRIQDIIEENHPSTPISYGNMSYSQLTSLDGPETDTVSNIRRNIVPQKEFMETESTKRAAHVKSHTLGVLSPCKETLERLKDPTVKETSQGIVPLHPDEGTEGKERFRNIMRASELNLACEAVNNHLLGLGHAGEDILRKSGNALRQKWFEVAAKATSNIQEVRNYIRFFEEFSDNLVKTLMYSTDANGNNVLHFAFANNRFDLAEELLRSGYATNILDKTNKLGNSPLMVCSISHPKTDGDWFVIRKSMELGDTNKRSATSGQTPLMFASSRGLDRMVQLLLEVGANPNIQDNDGSTALMYAAEHGHEICAKILLGHRKCDPSVRDNDEQTACSIALAAGHKNMAVLIHMRAIERSKSSKVPFSPRKYQKWTNKTSRSSNPAVVPPLPTGSLPSAKQNTEQIVRRIKPR